MAIDETLQRAQDAATVRRVYGEPYTVGDMTIIPAAAVRGGGGGGGGGGRDIDGNEGTGEGVGFGISARPVGAYVNKGDQWKWVPAFDVNRFFLIGNMVAVAFFISVWLVERVRARADVKIARLGSM